MQEHTVYLSAGNACIMVNNECVPDKSQETANLFSADMFQTYTFHAHLKEVLCRLQATHYAASKEIWV